MSFPTREQRVQYCHAIRCIHRAMLDHVCLVYRERALSRRERLVLSRDFGLGIDVGVGCFVDFYVERPSRASRCFL